MIETADPRAVGLSAVRLERLGRWMARYVDTGRLAGALTLVARGGRLAWLACAGDADREAGRPMREDTVVRIYSMTKPITAVAAMTLYEEGCFQLDDPVSRFLPAFAETPVWAGGEGDDLRTEALERPILVRDLLTHTAGFTYGSVRDTPVEAIYRARGIDFSDPDAELADLVDRLATVPLVFQPGTRWRYGVATDVLGRLVEVWSGKRLDAFLRERILAPLGMADTGFHVAPDALERFAALYRPGEAGGLELAEAPAESRFARPPRLHSGGGGLVSTAGDYLRFAEMLRRGGVLGEARLLGRRTVDMMRANHLPGGVDMAALGQPRFSETTHEGVGHGLGFAVTVDPVRVMLPVSPGELFWGGAASTAFFVDPAEELSVVFLTQLLPSSTYPLRRELRTLVYQAIVD